MIARLVIGALIAGSIVLIAYELGRWRDPIYRAALSGPQKARRIAGSLLLLAVLGMVYGGTLFPSLPTRGSVPPAGLPRQEQLNAALEMLYWLLCLLLAVFLPAIAYIEAKVSLTNFANERRKAKTEATEGMEDLIRRALGNTPSRPANGNKPPPVGGG